MKPVLALALSLLAAHATAAAEIDAYVELCLPEVGSLMQHAYMSFGVVAEFVVDSGGRATGVVVRDPRFLNGEALRSCVSSWRLTGVSPGSRFTARWQWIHGDGWDHLVIEGPGFKQRIVINGDHCYYCPGEAEPSGPPPNPAPSPEDDEGLIDDAHKVLLRDGHGNRA